MVKCIKHLLLVIVFVVFIEDINCSSSIVDTVSRYYKCELQKAFKQAWQKYKKSYENAIAVNLKENVGVLAMNVFVTHDTNPLWISAGFFFSDNVVDVLLFGLTMREMPQLIMPEVTLAPASNLLRVEASLSKIFIDTHYYTPRNDSTAVKYRMESQDFQSPFSLEQVQRFGSLTIIAEDCFLSGFSIITLVGSSLNVGHSPIRISDCKFTIEISSNDLSTPPVIAPYFSDEPGKQIEQLLTNAILVDLVPKIQGTMYAIVNTSETFGENLNDFRLHQQKLFMKTADYMSDVCVRMNNFTLQASMGHVRMSSLIERFEMMTDDTLMSVDVTLDDMVLYGLDTAHAARTGGSFEAATLRIADAIRFRTLQVRGKSKFVNATRSDAHEFAAELIDVTVNVVLYMDKDGSKLAHKIEVVGWRKLDFSVLPWETVTKLRVWYQSLITGYVINEVPARIIQHLSSVFTPAVEAGDESDQNPDKKEYVGDILANNDNSNYENDNNDNDNNGNNSGNDNNGKNNGGNDDANDNNEENNNDEDIYENGNDDENIIENANSDKRTSETNNYDEDTNANVLLNIYDDDNDDNNGKDMNDELNNGQSNNDKVNNDEDNEENNSDEVTIDTDNNDHGLKNSLAPDTVLIFGKQGTKLAKRTGIITKQSKVKYNINNNTRLGIQKKSLKGLSSKKLRSNTVRLTSRKNQRLLKGNMSSV